MLKPIQSEDVNHRLVGAVSPPKLVETARPFSNFNFLEKTCLSESSIRRIFSRARAAGANLLVVEDIPAAGVIADENAEIVAEHPDYEMRELRRLSFWRTKRRQAGDEDRELIAYAIAKRDVVPRKAFDEWHVFESVFRVTSYGHNYVHGARSYRIRVGKKEFSISGVLYCQQNGLNKACAQVALRTLCSLHVSDLQLPYSRINKLAAQLGGFDIGEGLNVSQIHAVLEGLGIGFNDADYSSADKRHRRKMPPYQKFLYAGVESGSGALLGFQMNTPESDLHIVPFFGHTFDRDTWVPNAEEAYFRVGSQHRYLPSETWVSSFVGHDDNFGSDFCVPRLYLSPEQVQYVVELLPKAAKYSGMAAEAMAIGYLNRALPDLAASKKKWLRRLTDGMQNRNLVLRAVPLSSAQYLDHLGTIADWNYRRENPALCAILEKHVLPKNVWMVEVSVQELFPTNQRKLGEIVLDAAKQQADGNDFEPFVLARFPGRVLLFDRLGQHRQPKFVTGPSKLGSHTPLFNDEMR